MLGVSVGLDSHLRVSHFACCEFSTLGISRSTATKFIYLCEERRFSAEIQSGTVDVATIAGLAAVVHVPVKSRNNSADWQE